MRPFLYIKPKVSSTHKTFLFSIKISALIHQVGHLCPGTPLQTDFPNWSSIEHSLGYHRCAKKHISMFSN